MSASAIRRKSYKKAQEDTGLFSPAHWEGDSSRGGSNEVPAGKLQVMEKFFTPVQQAPEGKGGSDVALWDCQCHQKWPESRSDRFSTLSSSSSTSASSASRSSASWSSATSLDKEAFLPPSPRFHSQSCVDVSGEGKAFQCGRQEDTAYKGEEPAGSFARLRKGQSKSADRLPHRQTPHMGPLSPGSAEGVDRHLYKATSLERSLVFNEQAEILAPRQPHQTGMPAPSKGILKNGALATTDRLRKAKSIETITVWPVGREASSALGPPRPLQREKQPPNTLDLSTPKKLPVTERMKLVEEKLRFSEFLNEITRQVLSPSSLSSLGWKPPEATSISTVRTPSSSDGSEPKGSGSKASSPGSFLEMAEGKAEEKASHGRRRPGQPEARGEAHHNQRQISSAPARTVSPELSPIPNQESLPKQPAEATWGQRKQGEGTAGTTREAEGPELPPKKAEQAMAEAAEQSDAQEQQELPLERSTEQLTSPPEPEQTSLTQKADVESTPEMSQRDLQKTWEELDALKDKFSRLQEDYSNTRHANQLLEEKLQKIAQSMTEERQALNQQISGLLERLISAQNTICSLENMNISGLLSRPSRKHQHHVKKAESSDSLSSLQILDVAPPAAFMDGTSDTHTTPSQSDSATEASKLGCSSESDTAVANGEQSPLLEYVPLPEEPKRHEKSHSRATAFTPWKQKSTKFSVDVNSTESECSGEEAVCPLPTPRFFYLRQEALVTPSGPSPLPTSEPLALEATHSASPNSLPPGGHLELVLEMSSSESSDGEVSWSPGLVEKTSGSSVDYLSAQKMLDSLLHKSSALENREKETRKAGRPGGYRFATCQQGSSPGRLVGRQHRIRYYQDFPSPRKEPSEAKSHTCVPHGIGFLPRDAKGAAMGLEGCDAAQDSTSL